jgi:hypothetical protein
MRAPLLPRIAAVRDGAMSNRHNANCLLGLGELVDDAVSADAKRAESPQPPAKYVAGRWVVFEQSERVLYRVNEGPVKLEQLTSGAAREDDACHRSAR